MKQSRTHTKLIADHQKLKGDYEDLKEQIGERDKLIKALKDKIKKFSHGGRKNSSRKAEVNKDVCLLYTSPSPRDLSTSRMPSSA